MTVALADFPVRWELASRWADVDRYGHVNNAVYYEYFDTAINAWLATAPGVDLARPEALGVVAESHCRFVSSVLFPSPLVVGLEVTRLGRTSVTYRLALFVPQAAGQVLAATCDWVHVYVDPVTQRPVPVPAGLRQHLAGAVVTASQSEASVRAGCA